MSALALKKRLEGTTGDQKKLCPFSLFSYIKNYYLIMLIYVMIISVRNNFPEMSLYLSHGLENFVGQGGKYGWSKFKEAVSVCFVQLR